MVTVAQKNRAELHITFDLGDPTQAKAYQLLTENATPRKASAYITDCIIARSDMEYMANLVLEQAGIRRSAAAPSPPGDAPARKRGRPKGSRNKTGPSDAETST